MDAQIIKETYYIEVTDDRVDLDPPYVWQSEEFDNKTDALKFARKVAASFNRSSLEYLVPHHDYLNPDWEKSARGIKQHLHVDLMVMLWYDENSYDIDIEDSIK